MERKKGEIFEHNGEWYQCVEGAGCYQCAFNRDENTCTADNPHCTCRSDKKDVVFKKLEKVGEPYMLEDKKFQKYRVFHTPYIYNKIDYSWQSFADPYYISLEIKQNKEDMEDLDKIKVRDYTKVEELNIMEENKLNLKPFDIQKAREGKPVCTRDGRKARIICFDRICGDDYYKIVACVTAFDGDFEEVLSYGIDGYIVDSQNPKDEDLMMLPEKKEGWVNVYKGGLLDTKSYPTKKEAFDKACPEGYVDTINISWEE